MNETKYKNSETNLHTMRKSFLLLLGLMLSVAIMATERTADEAAQIAAQFTNNHPQLRMMHKSSRGKSNMSLAYTRKKINSEKPAFYVFNQEQNNGYVIVSADDLTEDVLVYSESGSFDYDKANPNLRFWLNRLTEEISAANEVNAVVKKASDATETTAATAIAPLLGNTTWYQETPYSNLCPIDKWDNTRCLTGCVATAAAQIMRKWQWPKQGTGSKTYTWENYTYDRNGNPNKLLQSVELTANFGATTYDWDNMLDSYEGVNYTDKQAEAVATLMYHCGVACEMIYGGDKADGSGAYTEMMGDGMVKYFGYKMDKFVSTYSEADYTDNGEWPIPDGMEAEWQITTAKLTEYFNQDLEAGRPILMGGADNSQGGHEFVCDGRDSRGYFHINWGWEGDGNCYCKLTSLKPSTQNINFSSSIDALIGVEPANMEVDTVYVTGVSVAPTELTLKINETAALTATVAPQNATVKSVEWTSSNEKVATVDAEGKVTGMSAGEATVTATTVDGGLEASCKVTVTQEVLVNTEFTLVNKESELVDGNQIIIVASKDLLAQAATLKITSTQTTSYMGAESVTISDNKISLPENSNVAILTLSGNATAGWTLTNENGEVLGANSTKNVAWGGTYDTWTISITNGKATIAPSGSVGKIMYNSGYQRFTTYQSSTMMQPQIFTRKKPYMPTTAVDEVKSENKASKVIRDGRLLIIRDGVTYDVLGNAR